MSFIPLSIVGLYVLQVSGLATPVHHVRDDSLAAAASISSILNSPTFVPWSKPNGKIEEFIALGDSYTAGTGCNGLDEIVEDYSLRGQRSYPMQMSTDKDSWAFINGGDETLPRFSFHAYTGDTTEELVTQQIQKRGPYKDDKHLPRGQPFGAPQIAVLTIGGNDALLSKILEACVYQLNPPESCDAAIRRVEGLIDDGVLERNVNFALFKVAEQGRLAGGASPRNSFQTFVLGYLTFFNEEDPRCNDVSWGFWFFRKPKLTIELRQRLNALTRRVNGVIRKSAEDLAAFNIVFVEGPNEAYNGHRYCEPGMIDNDDTGRNTWFWSSTNRIQVPSEGSDDPNFATTADDVSDPQQKVLDFVFPGQNYRVSDATAESTPWTWENFPTWDELFKAMAEDDDPAIAAVPFQYARSFHPKGTAYAAHATELFAAIADNRDMVASTTPKPPALSPDCASSGTKFSHAPAEDFISRFCGNKNYWDNTIVPPISFGNGSTPHGGRKGLGHSDSIELPGTSNRLWLALTFNTENNCFGSFKFTAGTDDESKLDHCKKRFRTILNGCHTDTTEKKLGGTLNEVCRVYTVTAAPENRAVFENTVEIGDLQCKPTDTSLTGGDRSPLAGTCTCWYSKFPDSTNTFNMPESGDCKDTDSNDFASLV